MSADAVRGLLPTLQLIPVLLGSGGTIAWIVAGLPGRHRPEETPSRRDGSAAGERPAWMPPGAEADPGMAVAAAYLDKMRRDAEFWSAVADRTETWGRALAGRIAIVLYVAATVATVLNWRITEALPPLPPCP